ncbi:cytochrome C oxidase subunit IV family protein [Mycolicibacterium bacteremicum]|uniref:cytochrome C oxidase subunit IV family protein n=1 Tax=Mycolicibacterium bacteremicum TaxID=564198 RepID=UPI0026F357FD|nr:cytochrome C oxidase subunit IV family protein [Mycolicibacterium bacteremicum]
MTALNLLRNRAGASWLFLVAATVLSWAVGAEHGTGSTVAVLVLGIAAIKVRLVGLDFMELRHAPLALRAAFEAYCLGLWAVLSALYLWL